MYNTTKKMFALALCIVMGFSACKKSKNEDGDSNPDEKKYGVLMMVGAWPNTAYYLLGIPSLTEGTIDLKGKGVNVSNIAQDQGFIQKDGFYYYYNTTNSRLGKYHIENDLLVTDKEVPFTAMGGFASHVWLNDNTLVVFGTNGDNNKILYATINTSTLAVTGNGEVSTPAMSIPASYQQIGVAFAQHRDGKIFLGYGFTAQWPNLPYPKVLVAVINSSNMSVSKILEDGKSKWPGGPTRYTPYSFIDEKNDLYFATIPDNGWDYDGGSLLYRIKSGSDELDATYSFDFSSKSNGHTAQAMWYIGNGQAIIRVRIPSDRSLPDFYYKWDSYFSVVNVYTGAIIKKLELPTDKGEVYVQAVVVENGKAYIMLNGENSAGAIWEYDPASTQLKKGATFGAGYDYLLRLDKWK